MAPNGNKGIERISSGIDGLDNMLKGGLLKRRHIVIGGGPGSGKTLLGIQYLYKGAKVGEKGVFISLEEPSEKIVQNIKSTFPGWTDLDDLMSKGMIDFVKIQKHKFYNLVDLIQAYVTQHDAKRVVIDSATVLKLYFDTDLDYRKNVFDLLDFLSNLDCTVLITQEIPEQTRDLMVFGIEIFVADGAILLYNIPREEKRIRAVEILKMRGTDHSRSIAPLKFTPTGIAVYPEEKVY